MATVKIYRDEAEDEILPHVCMRCGEPATHFKRKRYGYPQMTVNIPLCNRHHFHFTILWAVVVGGFFMVAGSIAMAIYIAANQPNVSERTVSIFTNSITLMGCLWLVAVGTLWYTRVAPHRKGRDWIEFINVSPEFRDAMLDEREYQEEQDDNRDDLHDSQDEGSSHITYRPRDERMRP